jgi:large subunit ribosomal protein L10Ae
MSKIGSEKMKAAIHEMLTTNRKKERKFKETIDLQIGLKDYDINKDKRFQGVVKLPFVVRPRLKICVIADAVHSEQCKKDNIDFITTDSLSKKVDPNDKKGKQLKKWCRHYKILFVSESIVGQLPKLGGKFFSKWGKFPFVIKGSEQVKAKVDEQLASVKFQLKKVLCLAVAVGNVDMTEEQIRQNLTMTINFLISLLKKGWNNIKSLYIKTTMGHPVSLF